ncbi:UMP-CMP kinase 3-like isoform X2 [Pistacia vera]|nr:UMP-CMP kinase 3-like isoform X2 [Pistacia vera]XP_031279355.1 UMP-CMP kinase 3-like isoform X2 [Pistacia vera]
MIQDLKKEGKLVPSDIVVKVLEKAMQGSKNNKFLIDGFPRSQENLDAAQQILKIDPVFVLFFDCSEEEMIKRLLNRNQGRVDDNIESIKKRLKVYFESTLPIINYYSSKGKIRKINAERPIEEVFGAVKDVFSKLKEASMESKSSTN